MPRLPVCSVAQNSGYLLCSESKFLRGQTLNGERSLQFAVYTAPGTFRRRCTALEQVGARTNAENPRPRQYRWRCPCKAWFCLGRYRHSTAPGLLLLANRQVAGLAAISLV